MKNKKCLTIAFVSDAVYPFNKGGKEKRLYEMSTRLVNAGHNVHIYCMKWWKTKDNERFENGVYLHAISPLFPLYSGKRRSIKQAIFFALACFKLLAVDFDVIDVDHMPHLVLFSTKIVTVLKRKKLYVTWNEVWGREYWNEYLGRLGNIAYIIEWLSVRMPDEIIAVSKHTKNKLITDLGIQKNITVVPNGIDLKVINSIKPSKCKSDIIFAGRLLSHKNVNLLISSIHLLKSSFPNIKCIIVGKGPEEKKLKKLVRSLQIKNNVLFYDFLENQNDLYALMKASKVFVFPSTREGFGIAALEANASGIPVITTDHQDNATKDLIKNGLNGETVQLDKNKIAKIIKKYLTTNLVPNNYITIVKKYNWDALSKRIERVYSI
ncbi:MAG TPA: glycosyltransferase family 4 protein [Candidatus Sulfotelmatobacter sp.]|jgi:glycosyltransferase involved in cell wall biosynthesis|nr:glycosyltransferase family 4 protein [Candidatus Sulfotelmatobacter sp.]